VAGSRATPYRVTVRVRTFDDAGWDRLLDAVAARAAHTAALLDGELTPDVVADAQQAGVELLPGPGDLQPRCSCPDWADPCKHSAAVCYLMADRLDEDPFELLHVRGRTRDAVLDGLRRRRAGGGAARPATVAAAAPDTPPADPGVPAREVWTRARTGALPGVPPARRAALPDVPAARPRPALPDVPPARPAALPDVPAARPRPGRPDVPPARPAALPDVPAARPRPGRPAPPVGAPDGPSPLSAASLERLALDAAHRAWEAARGDTAALGLDLDHDIDLARRAALALGTPAWDQLARAAGMPARVLVERASAWRAAGAGGVRVVQAGPWRPDPLVLAAARSRLAGHGPLAVRHNTITVGGEVQLRLGHDGCWYRFERRGARSWELTAGPADEPDALVGL
jgi:hypothetical protein